MVVYSGNYPNLVLYVDEQNCLSIHPFEIHVKLRYGESGFADQSELASRFDLLESGGVNVFIRNYFLCRKGFFSLPNDFFLMLID